MVAEKSAEAARPRAVDELKESRRRLLPHVIFGVSYGVILILLSFLVPGISMEHQIMCWETALLTFAMTGYLIWTHLTVHETGLPPV